MSEENAPTPEPNSDPAPQPTPEPAPQPTPQPTPEPAPHNARDAFDGRQLLESVNALPEKIVNAIREATPQQTPSPSTAPTKTKTTENPNPDPAPGKRQYQSFAHRWFGISS